MSGQSSQHQGSPGNPDQTHQHQGGSWTSSDGQGTSLQSLQTWTGSSQAMVPAFSAPPAPTMTASSMPPMPAMLSANDFFQQGQQMFQASLDNSKHFMDRSMDLHARVLEQGQKMAQSMSMSINMNNMYQQPMFQQQAPPPPPPIQQPQNISYIQNIYHHHAPQQSPPQQIVQPPQQMRIENQESDNRFQAIEQRRERDIRDLNQAGAKVNDRLQDLERQLRESQSSNRESKRVEHELQQLREQNAQMARQQLEDNKRRQEEDRRRDEEYRRRRGEDMAEWRRSQVQSPQPFVPALDMDALRKLILETQSKQLSSEDIHQAVEQAVNQRLLGAATKEDIEAANRSMCQRLSLEPKGVSEEQVQRAFGTELNKIVASIQSQRGDQRRVEAPTAQRNRVETEFIIEEIEGEPVRTTEKPSSQISHQKKLPPTLPQHESAQLNRNVAHTSRSSKRESRAVSSPQPSLSTVAPVKPTTTAFANSPARTPEQSARPTQSQASSRTEALPAPGPSTAISNQAPTYGSEDTLTRTKRQTAPSSVSLPQPQTLDMSVARLKKAQQTSSAAATNTEMVRSGHAALQRQHSPAQPPSTTAKPRLAGSGPRELPPSSTPQQLPAPPAADGGQRAVEQTQVARVPRQQTPQTPRASQSHATKPPRQLEGPSAAPASHTRQQMSSRPPRELDAPPSATLGARGAS